MKPLWAIFAQANGLSVNPFVLQTQQAFLEGTLFQPRFRRKKDAWCDMAHSVVERAEGRGNLSCGIKKDEREWGGLWLDKVDVSVMVWC